MTVAELQKAIAELVLTELDLGLTFLDVAATTADRKHAARSIKNAITALRTANQLLPQIESFNVDSELISERRDQLTQRLREISGLDESGRGPRR